MILASRLFFLILVFQSALVMVTAQDPNVKRSTDLREKCYSGDAGSDCAWFAIELYGQSYTYQPGKDIKLTNCEKLPGTDGEICKVERSFDEITQIDFTCFAIPETKLQEQNGTIIWDQSGPHIQTWSNNYKWTFKKSNDQRYSISQLICSEVYEQDSE